MSGPQWAAFVFIILMMVIIALTGNKPDPEPSRKHNRLMKEIRGHDHSPD